MNNKKYTAIVLSAGSGSRMKSDIPKQYLMLGDYPVIYYSLKAFEESAVDNVILVAGAQDISFCENEIVKKFGLKKVQKVVAGAAERYLSVYEGIKAAADADYILIHDGARPLLSVDLIGRCMKNVEKEKACVPAVLVKDTIKISDSGGYITDTPDRSSMWAAQTPQSFAYPLLLSAYEKLFVAQKAKKADITITDDAMLVEQFTERKVKLIEGSYKNLKITTPEDMQLAKLFLKV